MLRLPDGPKHTTTVVPPLSLADDIVASRVHVATLNSKQLMVPIPFGQFARIGLIKRASSRRLSQQYRKKARTAWAATHTTR